MTTFPHIDIAYDPDFDAIVVTPDGNITFSRYQELVDTRKDLPHFTPGSAVIYDLRSASASTLRVEDVYSIVRYAKSLIVTRQGPGQVALVVSGNMEYGMMRMIQEVLGEGLLELLVTKNIDEARNWILSKKSRPASEENEEQNNGQR
jgi:hypothetical protein